MTAVADETRSAVVARAATEARGEGWIRERPLAIPERPAWGVEKAWIEDPIAAIDVTVFNTRVTVEGMPCGGVMGFRGGTRG